MHLPRLRLDAFDDGHLAVRACTVSGPVEPDETADVTGEVLDDPPGHRRGGQRARAAELLAEGASPVEVAAALGVSRTTGWRLAQEPEVLVAVKSIRDARAHNAALRIEHFASRAAQVLGELVEDRDMPPIVRLRAACELLDRAGYGHVERSARARVDRELAGFLDTLKRTVDAPTYVSVLEALHVWAAHDLESSSALWSEQSDGKVSRG